MSTDYYAYKLICTVDIKAEKTSCHSNETRIIDAELSFLGKGDDYIVAVSKGGVTGFENFGLKSNELNKVGNSDWMACCGRRGEWDQLNIPAKEMKKLYDKIIRTIKEHTD